MRKSILLAFAATSFLTSPADARKHEQAIVVEAQPTALARWSTSVSGMLEDGLRYPQPMGGQMPATGSVSVRFQCSEDGRPAALALHRKSGSRALDLAAMRAVSGVKTLHPMPAGLPSNQTFEANILFASSMSDYSHQLEQLQQEAKQRNAWFRQEPAVIALNAGARVPGQSR